MKWYAWILFLLVSPRWAGAQLPQSPTIIIPISPSKVELQWDDTQADVQYRVYHRLGDTNWVKDCAAVDTGNCRNAGTSKILIWAGPLADGVHYWTVTAYNVQGESGYSNVVNQTFPLSQGPPGLAGPAGAGFLCTSSTSNSVGIGTKIFTVQSGLAYTIGARVRVSCASNFARYMDGQISSYSGTSMSISVDTIGTVGTCSSWNVNPIGKEGAMGPQGFAGPTGQQGIQGAVGPQGSVGIQGLQGSTGVMGPKGDKGDAGEPGEKGAQGIPGPLGLQGPPGMGSAVNIHGPLAIDPTSTTIQLSWTTIAPTIALIEYQYAGGPFNSLQVTSAHINVHYVRLGNLRPATVYNYTIVCTAADGVRYETSGTFKTR